MALNNEIEKLCDSMSTEMIEFFRSLVRIQSYTGNEGKIAKVVFDKMQELGYDKVWQDKYGNVIGQIGTGETSIYFDSHMDTVGVNDTKEWITDPFGAEVIEGNVYGRGSADMKSGLVASMYAGAMMKKLGCVDGKRIYIAATVMEEDFDGVATLEVIKSLEKMPDYAVMCEPTCLNIGVGHKGRALTKITVNGKAAHGSRPDLGINPAYLITKVLNKIENWGKSLMKGGLENTSVAVTTIESVTDSYNSIPRSASLYIDHRLTVNDTEEKLTEDLNNIINGIDAKWEICDFPAKTWTGETITLHSLHPAWEIPKDHVLAQTALKSCKEMKISDAEVVKMGFSTNAVTTAGRCKIPTIVLGPGDVQFAHMTNEHCPIKDIIDACKIYTYMCHAII